MAGCLESREGAWVHHGLGKDVELERGWEHAALGLTDGLCKDVTRLLLSLDSLSGAVLLLMGHAAGTVDPVHLARPRCPRH